MPAKESSQGYTTVFIPLIWYAFPATSIPSSILTKIQIPIINNVLVKLGYKRHMPCADVFASTNIGGIGLLHKFAEQEGSIITTIISHFRATSYLSPTIMMQA
jgi:hypothetical protein